MTDRIFVIQEQNPSSGAWELTGHFFTIDKEADAYVNKKTFEAVLKNVVESTEACRSLADFVKRDTSEVLDLGKEGLFKLLKDIPTGILDEFAEELQCGGFFSYEALDNYDGKDPL